MHKTLPLEYTFHQTFLTLSVPITLFSHPKTATCKSDLLLFPFIKCNFIPHTFFTKKTHRIFLKQPRTDLYISILQIGEHKYVIISKNTFAFLQRTSQDGIKRYSLIVQNLQFLCKRKFNSVQSSHSVVSDSLRPHELQHARPPCPSPTPGVHSNSRPSSR